jgi:hypothetical protein
VTSRRSIASPDAGSARSSACRTTTLPASGVAGRSLGFSVSPFDVWSSVATRWSFGDGGTASGTSVGHVYAAAGTYTVTVTGSDAVGNATSARRTVRIAPPPVPDSDGDGFRDNQDCKPLNPKIHPGAKEKPENKVDENCDGADGRYPRIDPPAIFWTFNAAKTRFKVIKVLFTDVPNKMKAHVRCKGRGCPFRKAKTKKSRRHKLNLLPTLGRRVNFKPGQRFEVRATRRGFMGRVVRVKLRKGQVPKSKRLCLKPGTKKPRRCR